MHQPAVRAGGPKPTRCVTLTFPPLYCGGWTAIYNLYIRTPAWSRGKWPKVAWHRGRLLGRGARGSPPRAPRPGTWPARPAPVRPAGRPRERRWRERRTPGPAAGGRRDDRCAGSGDLQHEHPRSTANRDYAVPTRMPLAAGGPASVADVGNAGGAPASASLPARPGVAAPLELHCSTCIGLQDSIRFGIGGRPIHSDR